MDIAINVRKALIFLDLERLMIFVGSKCWESLREDEDDVIIYI
jgi:hypothetical protein